jgi:outer membrane lipoprotein SlyB
MKIIGVIAILATMVSGAACAADPARPAPVGTGSVAECRDCGTVRGIEQMQGSGQASGAGAILGAVIGGVVGHQFGSGRGQDAATAAGAVGGAAAGHQVEKSRKAGVYYEVLVKMDQGGTKIVNVADPAGLAVGSRVRVSGRNLEQLS